MTRFFTTLGYAFTIIFIMPLILLAILPLAWYYKDKKLS